VQTEIREPRELLDAAGRITKEGWARHPYWRYDRGAIKASALRVKEWDYYAVLSHGGRYGLTVTVSDLGYAGLYAVCFLDVDRGYYHQVDTLRLLPLGRTGLAQSPDDGCVSVATKKLAITIECIEGVRTLSVSAPGITDADGAQGLEGTIHLSQPPDLESINIATSWAEKRTAFYYNRKINCMPASGGFRIGSQHYDFRPETDFGTLDWGRGRWTYRNRWYWGSASGYAAGAPFGFNIGYGFTDRTPASENALFFAGQVHKLDEVTFHFDPSDYLRPWRFSSSDGRIRMDFAPILDRSSSTNLGLIRSLQHQVFGEFSGAAVLDDGTRIDVDRLTGFAEDVYNRW